MFVKRDLYFVVNILVTRIQVSDSGPMCPTVYYNVGDACRTKCVRMVILKLILTV